MVLIAKQYKQTTLFDYFKVNIKKENVIVKKTTSILSEMLSVLPSDLQNIVFSYDDTYKRNYNMIISEIQRMLSLENCLEFKQKYKCLGLNSWYLIVHIINGEHIRVASYTPEYEGCNSLLLRPYQLLLNMKNCIIGNQRLEEYDYFKFEELQSDIETTIDRFHDEFEDEN